MGINVLVVSHAGVLRANRDVYERLGEDFNVSFCVPRRWRDALRGEMYGAELDSPVPVLTMRVCCAGYPQRYFPIASVRSVLRRASPDVIVVEEEPFSLAGAIWAFAARRRKIPYGIQSAENLEKRLPKAIRQSRRYVLKGAAFILGRSPQAAKKAGEWGFRGVATVVPHGVLEISSADRHLSSGLIGFCGRVVSEKGTGDLLALLEENPSFRLRIAGSGMDEQMLRDSPVGARIEFLGTVASEKMSDFYQSVDVVVVPSRTTPAWSEQFGRVIVEAQAIGTPVVAYDSGEIPWVAAQSAAILICEGDVRAMGDAVVKLLSDAQYYDEVSRAGLDSVKKFCSNEVLADQISLLITASLAVS